MPFPHISPDNQTDHITTALDIEGEAGREHRRVAYFIYTNIDTIRYRVGAGLIRNSLRSVIADVLVDVEIGVDQAIDETLRRDMRSKSPDEITGYVVWLAKKRVMNLWARSRPRTIRLSTTHLSTIDLAESEETYEESRHSYFWCRWCPAEDGACTPNHERRKRLVEFLYWMRWNMTNNERDVVDLLLESKPHAVIARELGTTEAAVKQRWARIREREYRNNFELAQKLFGYQGKDESKLVTRLCSPTNNDVVHPPPLPLLSTVPD